MGSQSNIPCLFTHVFILLRQFRFHLLFSPHANTQNEAKLGMKFRQNSYTIMDHSYVLQHVIYQVHAISLKICSKQTKEFPVW